MNISELIEKANELEKENKDLKAYLRTMSLRSQYILNSAIALAIGIILFASIIFLTKEIALVISFTIVFISFLFFVLAHFISN